METGLLVNKLTFDVEQSILIAELRRLGADDHAIGHALEDADALDDWLGPHNWKPITSWTTGHYPRVWPALPRALRANVTGPEVPPEGHYVYLWTLHGGDLDGCGYVGKGVNQRWRDHFAFAVIGVGRGYFATALHAHLLHGGRAHCVTIADMLDEETAYALETLEIAKRGRIITSRGYLLNLDAGGEGGKTGDNNPMKLPEARAKLSASMRKVMADPKRKAATSGENSVMKRPEVRAKVSTSNRATWAKQELRDRHAALMRSSEIRAKISETTRAALASPEVRAKQKESSRALWDDPMRKIRHSTAVRERHKRLRNLEGYKKGDFSRRAREIFTNNPNLQRDEMLELFVGTGMKNATAEIYYNRFMRDSST